MRAKLVERSVSLRRIIAGLLFSALIGGLAYRRRSLSASGWIGAILTGTATFGFGGLTCGMSLITFFVTSSALSRFREPAKQRLAGDKFEKGGRRDLGQTLANGGAAGALAVAYGLGAPPSVLAAYAGVLGTVTADTWATELGVLAQQPPRLVTTWQPVPPGTSGAITLAGTAAGLAGAAVVGSAMVALMRLEQGRWLAVLLPAAVVGGGCGSLADSALGATVQAIYQTSTGRETEHAQQPDGTPHRLVRGWRWMNNDAVNFLSSLIGGVCGWAAAMLLRR